MLQERASADSANPHALLIYVLKVSASRHGCQIVVHKHAKLQAEYNIRLCSFARGDFHQTVEFFLGRKLIYNIPREEHICLGFIKCLGTTVNTLRPRWNDRLFQTTASNAFLEWNEKKSHTISLKFLPKIQINNIPELVKIMAWRQPVSLLTHIC